MDFNHLKTFVTIAREGSLARASNALCLSQPALSTQIKALENSLGLQLFERMASGMKLSYAGELLLTEAQRILEEVCAMQQHAKNLQRDLVGTVRIGTISEPGARLGACLSQVRTLYPNLKIHLENRFSADLVERVLKHELDAAYIVGDTVPASLASLCLAAVKVFVIAPATWAQQIKTATWAQIIQFPWVWPPPQCSLNPLASRMFAEHGVAEPQKIIEADQRAVGNLVANGLGLSLMREEQAVFPKGGSRIIIWKKARIQTHLHFIYHRDKQQHAIVSALRQVVQEVWQLTRSEPI